MGRGRAIASSVAVAMLIGVCGACNGGGSKSYTAAKNAGTAQTRAAASARAKIAAARRELAVAERRAAAQRHAIAARRRAQAAAQRRRQQSPTTTTTAPPLVDPTPESDHAAIQRTVTQSNAAFGKSVAAGIAYSEAANYWVSAGVYSSATCAAFEAASGGGVVSESLVLHPDPFQPAPGWVDPVVGKAPAGRVYAVAVDQIQTLVPTGEQRQQSTIVHATVLPDGRAQLLLRCA